MKVRNVIRAGLAAAILATGGVVLSPAPAQAFPREQCNAQVLVPIQALMSFWWGEAQWLEANGGSDNDIEWAYYQYMVAESQYEAAGGYRC